MFENDLLLFLLAFALQLELGPSLCLYNRARVVIVLAPEVVARHLNSLEQTKFLDEYDVA